MPRELRSLFVAFAVLLTGCAVTPPRHQPAPSTVPPTAEAGGWVPQPGAQAALEALWAARPFELPAARLGLASGGVVPTMYRAESLLFTNDVRVDEAGRSRETTRWVWRILGSGHDHTQSLTWSPWREEKPTVRARVVSPNGAESWVEPTAIVEGSVNIDGLVLSDVKQLSLPLPNARTGSVVELEVVRSGTRALLEGAGAMGSWGLWSDEPARRERYSVEVPASAPLKLEMVGFAKPTIEKSATTQRFALDLVPRRLSGWALTRPEQRATAPRFTWSTTPSWEVVAQRYRALLDDAFADQLDTTGLTLAAGRSRTERIQAVMRWVSDRVRYTAVHLGAGAIIPTRPSVVLKRGYGDCKDLAVLATVALRQAGIEANVALVMARGEVPHDNAPGLGAFNHMVVAVAPQTPGEAPLFIDATAPEYPVGTVPPAIRDQRALIAASGTRGLTPMPTRAQSQYGLRQTFELHAAPFSHGSARVVVEHTDGAEGAARSTDRLCEADTAHKLAASSVEVIAGDAPFTAKVAGCKAGEGPVVLTAEVKADDRLDTGDKELTISLPSRVVDLAIPDWLPGERPGSNDETTEQHADRVKRLLAETGLTEAQVKGRAHSFESQQVVERVYRLSLPAHFMVPTLPEARTIEMGPGRWSERYTRVNDELIEVQFRFEVTRVDWSIADVEAFRTAFWKRFDESVPQVTARFVPIELMTQKKSAAAVALMRKWLEEQPTDGVTRARYARVLLQMGLGDLARREVDRAMKDAPDEALVAMVCGDVARHDAYGLLYEPPFDRQRSLECFRKARELMPHHTWANHALADTLRRNANGEPETKWTADVQAAAQLLQSETDAHEASDAMARLLLDLNLATGRKAEAVKLIAAQPRLAEGDAASRDVIETIVNGPDAALRRAQRIADAKERLKTIIMGYGALVYLREYDEAGAYLARAPSDPAIEKELTTLRALHKGLKSAPDRVDLSTPEAAARTVSALASNASTPTEASVRLAALASASGKAELDGSPRVFRYVQFPSFTQRYLFDQLYSRGACRTETAEGVGSRVRCEVPDNRKLLSVSYWVREGGKLKLESLGRPSQLANLAWRAAQTNQLKAAQTWLGWYIDELTSRGVESSPAFLLRNYWSQAAHDDAASVRYAAAVGLLVYGDMVENAPEEAIAVLDHHRSELSGAMRRNADQVLASALHQRKKYDMATDVFEQLAKSENEPWMWRLLATYESKGSRLQQATERVNAALKKDAGSAEWRSVKATIDLRAGRYTEAISTLEALRRDKGVDVSNNLIWAHVMASKLDDELERETLRMANEHESQASLHTAAMVLLERDRVLDAADYGMKRHRMLGGGEPDEAQWLFRGRLLQVLGFRDLSREALGKVRDDVELRELARRHQLR